MKPTDVVYQWVPSGLDGEAVAYYHGVYPGPITFEGERITYWELPHFDVGGFDVETGNRTPSGNLTDFLNNDVGWLIVSQRIRDALESAGIGEESIQWLDVCLHTDGGEVVGEYFVANLLDIREAVHPAKSTYLGPDRTLTRFVLRRSALEGARLFRVKELLGSVFVSEEVKRLLEQDSVTGIEWWKKLVAD